MAEPQPEVRIRIIKKKGGHGGGHSGGAWKVAYADLVTALMAFFLLMWLLNSTTSNTKAGIAGMFQDPDFFNTEKGQAILAEYAKEKAGILPGGKGMQQGDGEGATPPAEDTSDAERQAMEATAATISKAFNEDKLSQVLFDSGSAQLKPYTMAILKEIGQELGKLPNHLIIGGHTDSMTYPGKGYTNWELSADRANAARRVLEAAGLQHGQVQRVTGYADKVPLENHDSTDPQNRRISIVVMSSATERAEGERQKVKPARTGAPAKAAETPKVP